MNKSSLEIGALGSEAIEAIANLIRNKGTQPNPPPNPNAELEDGQPPYKSAAEGDINSFANAFDKAKEFKPKKNKVNSIPVEAKTETKLPTPKVHSSHKADIFKKMMQHKLPVGIGLGVAGLTTAAFLQHKKKKD